MASSKARAGTDRKRIGETPASGPPYSLAASSRSRSRRSASALWSKTCSSSAALNSPIVPCGAPQSLQRIGASSSCRRAGCNWRCRRSRSGSRPNTSMCEGSSRREQSCPGSIRNGRARRRAGNVDGLSRLMLGVRPSHGIFCGYGQVRNWLKIFLGSDCSWAGRNVQFVCSLLERLGECAADEPSRRPLPPSPFASIAGARADLATHSGDHCAVTPVAIRRRTFGCRSPAIRTRLCSCRIWPWSRSRRKLYRGTRLAPSRRSEIGDGARTPSCSSTWPQRRSPRRRSMRWPSDRRLQVYISDDFQIRLVVDTTNHDIAAAAARAMIRRSARAATICSSCRGIIRTAFLSPASVRHRP